MEPTKRHVLGLRIMLPIGLGLAAANMLLWLYLGLVCSFSDDPSAGAARLCNHGHPQARINLPVLGAVAMLLSLYLSRRYRRNWIFVVGGLVALTTGVYIYAVAHS